MKCELVVAQGSNAEERFELADGQEVLIGRGEDCDLRLRDPSVSRHQCHIRREADRAMLSDLTSRWGTLVNGRIFKDGELKSGDRITLGDTEIVVHRNVTPSNILVSNSGQIVKLGDLYLAKALIGTNAFDVTRTDGVIGHLPYLSPEQIEHLPGLNHLSDLYSLGATLYALLTGHPPFLSDSPTSLLRDIATRVPDPIQSTHPEVPAHFAALVLRMLAKRQEDRVPNPAELLKQLRSDRSE